jgi:hypothetical protein
MNKDRTSNRCPTLASISDADRRLGPNWKLETHGKWLSAVVLLGLSSYLLACTRDLGGFTSGTAAPEVEQEGDETGAGQTGGDQTGDQTGGDQTGTDPVPTDSVPDASCQTSNCAGNPYQKDSGRTADGSPEGGQSDAGECRTDGATEGGTCKREGGTDASHDLGSLLQVASALHGKMLLAPCLVDSFATLCQTSNGACPVTNDDPVISGAYIFDTKDEVKLGGQAGQNYTITIHVQGVVEAKFYANSNDADSTLDSPLANGWSQGGTPNADNWNVYAIRVTNPGSTTSMDYFLNSLVPPGVSDMTVYGIDYIASFQAQGGATIRLVVVDAECAMIKNCGSVQNGMSCSAPIVVHPEPEVVAANPAFDFDAAYDGQWVSIAVKKVTSP